MCQILRLHHEFARLTDDYGGKDRGRVLAWPWDQGGFWMHRSGNNVLFDDLHVGLFDRLDLKRMTFPQAHAGLA